MLSAAPATSLATSEASRDAAALGSEARVPLCFVIDADASVRRFLSLILHGAGLNTEEFAAGESIAAAIGEALAAHRFSRHRSRIRRSGQVPRLSSPTGNYRGHVQLVSGRGSAVLAHVKNIGEQHHLRCCPY